MKQYLQLFSVISIFLLSLTDQAFSQGRVGYWKFDDPSNLLLATTGTNLGLVGTHQAVAGPAVGNGAVRIGLGSYYKVRHGIAPNGGGSLVNEYTLQFDFRVSTVGIWHTFFQTDTTNASDGDCFKNTTGKIGTAVTGYSSYSLNPNEWYRLVVSVKNGNQYNYYLDGELLLTGNVQGVDGRFALANLLLIFADNDGDDGEIDCAELGIWDRALTAVETRQLGGYGHLAAQGRVGLWKFDDPSNLLLATTGTNLGLVGSHQAIAGPVVGNGAVRIGLGSYYKMRHGIAPNGGGSYVNEYALQFDFRVSSVGIWHTFFQTDTTNASDGECFKNTTGKIGVFVTGYSTYSVRPDEWYRLVISVNNGNQYNYYLDGELLLAGSVQALDGRFALENLLLVFADNDGDDGEIDCAELAIWDRPLTAAEAHQLGGYGHTVDVKQTSNVPESYQLGQNYPNPFNPTTHINYRIAASGMVTLRVYDVLGREIATLVNSHQEAGSYTATVDIASMGKNLSSGVYFYRLESGSFTALNKMMMLK